MDFTPMNKFFLIKPEKEEKTTSSGIILTENKNELPSTGIVIKCPKNTNEPSPSEGDLVFFGKYSGSILEYEGITYNIIEEKDLYGFSKK
jgi:chaperonin GroES